MLAINEKLDAIGKTIDYVEFLKLLLLALMNLPLNLHQVILRLSRSLSWAVILATMPLAQPIGLMLRQKSMLCLGYSEDETSSPVSKTYTNRTISLSRKLG